MGLDVYLHQYDNFALSKLKEKRYEKQTDKYWQEVYGFAADDNAAYTALKEQKTAEEMEQLRDAYHKKCLKYAAEHGLDKYGEDDTDGRSVEFEAANKHDLFRVGYFRSSYNNSGINTVLREAIGKDLNYIFEPTDDYEFAPDWQASLERAQVVKHEWVEHLETVGAYRVEEYGMNEFQLNELSTWDVDSKETAMEHFKEVKARHAAGHIGMDSFSNQGGTYYLKEPLRVSAIITGTKTRFFSNDKLPTAYVVYEAEDLKWYTDALDVVIETCQYVLKQTNPDSFVLSWSA